MIEEAVGTVVSVKTQWWLKVNKKAVRAHPLDGAVFPHIIKISYVAEGCAYTKRKWFGPGQSVPHIGDTVRVVYRKDKPGKAKVFL